MQRLEIILASSINRLNDVYVLIFAQAHREFNEEKQAKQQAEVEKKTTTRA